MQRRDFLAGSLAGGPLLGAAPAPQGEPVSRFQFHDVVVERRREGKPHKGKMLAAIQPHCDDVPLFAGGTMLKLFDEGYEGIMIRTSNDEMAGKGSSVGDIVLKNEQDTEEVARRMGLKKTYHLGYRNHLMDGVSRLEMRARLIFLFRLMKVDTVVCYDPWGHYEENPDHWMTAQVVEAACWMAGGRWDYPEHFDAGLEPHGVREKYYFARGPQLVNRVVDVSDYVDKNAWVNTANVTQGPAGRHGSELRQRLAGEGKRLPLLGDDDETADREYIKQFVFGPQRELGERFGVEYAEAFHYIGPGENAVRRYVEENAVPL